MEDNGRLTLGCIILASGFSRRLGVYRNKLMEQIAGRKIIEYVMDAALCAAAEVNAKGSEAGVQISAPVVVTRWPEVVRACSGRKITVVTHEDPDQSDTIRHGLAVEDARQWDGCMFITGDQPLLTAHSIVKLAGCFREHPTSVCRLGFGEAAGNPVIFPASLFDDLRGVQGDRGGGAVIRAKGIEPLMVQAADARELWDVDTPDDLEKCREAIASA